MKDSNKILFWLAVAVVAMGVAIICKPADAGGCHVLYRQQAVVAHHAYAQQFVAPIVYQVGADIQQDAVAEKIAQRVAAKLQAIQAVQKQSVGNAVKSASANVLSAKCARCHGPSDPKGGVTLDGSQAVDDATFRSIVKMLGTGEGVPSAMKGIVAGLKPEEKGEITQELLNLESVSRPQEGVLE